MATPDDLSEILKSNRGKEKACIDGFLYTLKRSCHPHLHWICEKRATCKARITTKDGVVINPPNKSEIILSHTQGPEPMRVEMIKGITRMKDKQTSGKGCTGYPVLIRYPAVTGQLPDIRPEQDMNKNPAG